MIEGWFHFYLLKCLLDLSELSRNFDKCTARSGKTLVNDLLVNMLIQTYQLDIRGNSSIDLSRVKLHHT